MENKENSAELTQLRKCTLIFKFGLDKISCALLPSSDWVDPGSEPEYYCFSHFLFSRNKTNHIPSWYFYLPNSFICKPMKQRSRFGPKIKLTPNSNMAIPLEIFQIQETGRIPWFWSRNVSDHFLKYCLVAGNG